MLKLNYKNCIKKFIVFCLLSAFLTGCSQNKKEGASPIINEDKKQTDSQRQRANEKQAEQERKNKKLSEMYDWDSAKILTDWYYPSFGEGQILQNQDYIFYPEEGTKIVRISKSDGSKKIICEFDFTKGKGIHYCLADDGLFVEYASNIYFCDFDGVNRYKIISHKNLKERITKIKKEKWINRVDTLYFYKNNLYFTTISSYIWKLNPTTKKLQKWQNMPEIAVFVVIYYIIVHGMLRFIKQILIQEKLYCF